MLRDIEVTKNVITCESLAMLRPHEDTLKRLGGFFTDVSNNISDTFVAIGNAITAKEINEPMALRAAMNLNYMAVQNIKVEGNSLIGVDYLTATKVMLELAPTLESIDRDLLFPFSKWLAETINKPDRMLNLTQYVGTNNSRIKSSKEAFLKLTAKGSDIKTPYRNIIRRNIDWKEIVENLNKLSNYNLLGKLDAIQKKVTEIESMVDILIKEMNSPSFDYRPSGKFVSELTNTVYRIAEELEFYGNFCAALNSFIETARNNLIFISKVK